LNQLALDVGSKAKVEELVKAARDTSQKIKVLAEATAKNGKLDKTTVDSALDRILAAMKAINEELDQLLAKARG
jgi:chorismate mutase